jgi:hypothetical protein
MTDTNFGYSKVYKGKFTADEVAVPVTETVTIAAGATGELNVPQGVVTVGEITTAAGAVDTVTLTNSYVTTESVIMVSAFGSGDGAPVAFVSAQSAGSVEISIVNAHGSDALTATVKLFFKVM